MIVRPVSLNAYEFVVVAALRARQLMAGCVPRLAGEHTPSTMAQMEVADGRVARVNGPIGKAAPGESNGTVADPAARD